MVAVGAGQKVAMRGRISGPDRLLYGLAPLREMIGYGAQRLTELGVGSLTHAPQLNVIKGLCGRGRPRVEGERQTRAPGAFVMQPEAEDCDARPGPPRRREAG